MGMRLCLEGFSVATPSDKHGVKASISLSQDISQRLGGPKFGVRQSCINSSLASHTLSGKERVCSIHYWYFTLPLFSGALIGLIGC